MTKRETIAARQESYTVCSGLTDSELHWLRSIAISTLNDSSVDWRHNGQGLLQAYIAEGEVYEARLHVWHESLMKPGIVNNGLGHDHRFDMTSFVILGKILHKEYNLIQCQEFDPGACRILECTHARKAKLQGDYHMEPSPVDGYVQALWKDFVITDGKYVFPKFRFHRAINLVGTTVTLILKGGQVAAKARILDQFSIRPLVNAFENSKSREQFQYVLDDAREKLREANEA